MSTYGSDPVPPGQGRPDAVVCPNCRGENPPSAANCMWCGNTLQAAGPQQYPGQPGGQAASPAAPAQQYVNPYQPQQPPQPYAQQPYQEGYQQPQQPQYSEAPVQPQAPQFGPAPGVAVPTTVPAKPRRNMLLIIGGALLVAIVLCVVGVVAFGGFIFSTTQPAVTAGDNFMTAMRDDNWERAFEICSAELKQEVGNAEGLRTALSEAKPTSWTFTSRSVTNNDGTLGGTVTYPGGDTGNVEMSLSKTGDRWEVTGVSLK